MALPVNIVSKFIDITKFDLASYLNRYADFIEFRASNIVNLYLGNTNIVDNVAFEELNTLHDQSVQIAAIIELYKERISNGAFWELLEFIEDIKISIDSYLNAKKWTRSSINKGTYTGKNKTELSLNKFQTLENLSTNIGANNKENYWLKIALDNDLSEEDYTTNGGEILQVEGVNKIGTSLKSVVDTDIIGKKIYGKDIQRKIEFDSSQNDLVSLSYDDTLLQTVFVLATLKRGDNPEFENDGIQSNLLIGSNRASISFPILLRQFYATFNTDDSFKSILIKDIKFNQDSISLTLECETKIGEITSQIINF